MIACREPVLAVRVGDHLKKGSKLVTGVDVVPMSGILGGVDDIPEVASDYSKNNDVTCAVSRMTADGLSLLSAAVKALAHPGTSLSYRISSLELPVLSVTYDEGTSKFVYKLQKPYKDISAQYIRCFTSTATSNGWSAVTVGLSLSGSEITCSYSPSGNEPTNIKFVLTQ